MTTKISELYGVSTASVPMHGGWSEVASHQTCPFLSRKCLKNRKSAPEQTIGTCTLSHGKVSQKVMICPFRLLERRQIFEDCKELLALHQPGNEWHIVPELQVPGGSIDYCLASVRMKKVIDFIGIELQTLDTTGTIWPERQRFLRAQGVHVKTKDCASRKPFGMNWKMTAKTILVQLHHKIQTFEGISKKLVLVLQDHLMAYMKKSFRFSHLTLARRGDPMHFHSYALYEDNRNLKLQLAEQLSTDTVGIAACLGLQSESRVEFQLIVNQIESKLSDATLMSPESPALAASLVKKAAGDESR
ncbi:MAG TPA: hypothetical protein VKX17_01635 [Planctomycetota bacterium]|nr:hypothetical protein [Planctomycetota bacterium]